MLGVDDAGAARTFWELRYSVSKRVPTAVGPSQQQHGQLGSSGQPWQANCNMHDIVHGFWQKAAVDCTCGFGNPTRSVCARRARRARCAQKHRCTGAQVPLIARDTERSLTSSRGCHLPGQAGCMRGDSSGEAVSRFMRLAGMPRDHHHPCRPVV